MGAASEPSYKKAHPLFVDPPSDMSMSCTRRAEFESAVCNGGYSRFFSVFVASVHSTTDRPKKCHHFFDFKHHHSTHPDGPSFVGVQGHQKPLENTKTLMKIDVFLCLVVQESGFYRWGSAPPDPMPISGSVHTHRPTACQIKRHTPSWDTHLPTCL